MGGPVSRVKLLTALPPAQLGLESLGQEFFDLFAELARDLPIDRSTCLPKRIAIFSLRRL